MQTYLLMAIDKGTLDRLGFSREYVQFLARNRVKVLPILEKIVMVGIVAH